jgi:hypothetical protein
MEFLLLKEACHSVLEFNARIATAPSNTYESVTKSFRTGRPEREMQMVKLSATRCSCIAVLWVSLVSFAAITICVASQRVFIVLLVYFIIESVRKLLDTPSYFQWNVRTLRASKYFNQSCRQRSGSYIATAFFQRWIFQLTSLTAERGGKCFVESLKKRINSCVLHLLFN